MAGKSWHTRVAAGVLGFLMIVIGVVVTPVAALAHDDDGTVTWSVRPGGPGGADGRSWIELTLDPGDQVTEHMVVVNHSRTDVAFRLTAADGYFTDTGRFNMLPSDRESVEAGTWIDLRESIELAAGETAVIPFTVAVPPDATPGDHPAGVAASVMSSDGSLGVESRVGFRVMTRVAGDLTPALAVEAAGEFTGSVNPFEPGRLAVAYAVHNTGNVRLGASVVLEAAGPLGLLGREEAGEPIAEFAPGESRKGELVLRAVWPGFVYTADVVVTPMAANDQLEVSLGEPATATITVLAIPWPQLVVLALAAALVLVWWRGRTRQRRRMEVLVEQAREEGRRSAASAGVAQAVVMLVTVSILLGHAPAARADAEDSRGVRVDVNIAPLPTTPPHRGPEPELPPTGGVDVASFGLVGAGLIAAGAISISVARRSRRHGGSLRRLRIRSQTANT